MEEPSFYPYYVSNFVYSAYHHILRRKHLQDCPPNIGRSVLRSHCIADRAACGYDMQDTAVSTKKNKEH